MSKFKYLVMATDSTGNHSGFLHASFSGERCTDYNATKTFFKPHDFGGGHENDDYWNDPEELLVGFSRWYSRWVERNAYHMGNRLYAATNTYRFFKVNTGDYGDCEEEMKLANQDLLSYEVCEDTFVEDMLNSYEVKMLGELFATSPCRREKQPVQVEIHLNKEHNTWSWISDYLKKDKDDLTVHGIKVPVGLDFDAGVAYLTDYLGCPYRFGGNDAYNKRKELEK